MTSWNMAGNVLFPTPLYALQHPQPEAFNTSLHSAIQDLQHQYPQGIQASNVLGWHSPRDIFNRAAFVPLYQVAEQAMREVAQALGYGNFTLFCTDAWANVNSPYASNQIHNHPNNLLSGVYYVQVPPESGTIVFYDPRPARLPYQPQVAERNTYIADTMHIQPQPGLMLIFPSWLNHSVSPNLSSSDRVSISFNYNFRTGPAADQP